MISDSIRSLELSITDENSVKEVGSSNSRKNAAAPEISSSKKNTFHFWTEVRLLMKIAAPAVVVQFSVLFIFPQTASAVGLVLGTDALAGFSLGSLVGNLTITSIMAGALSAADILMPRAYGAKDYNALGILYVRSFLVCTILLIIPIIPLYTCMEYIFDRLGQDRDASHLAASWMKLYLLGTPSVLLFRVTQSFLNSQHQPYPMLFASIIASYVVHPVLLKIFVPTMGENGSAVALAMTQWTLLGLMFAYLRLKPMKNSESWPKIMDKAFLKEALQPIPLIEFVSLSLGGVLVLSEWWLWETVCFIVGTFGVVPLVVHTIAYNLVPLLFMPTLGMSIGLTVRMGNVIAYDVHKAKQLAFWSMMYNVAFGAILCTFLFWYRIEITMMFTDDPEVIEGCKIIWPKLCSYIFVLHILGINTAISRALGLQWRIAIIIFGYLWFIVLPCIVFFAMHRQGGLNAVWTILPILYAVLQIFLISSYLFFADWTAIGKDIYQRSHGISNSKNNNDQPMKIPTINIDNENSPLINASAAC